MSCPPTRVVEHCLRDKRARYGNTLTQKWWVLANVLFIFRVPIERIHHSIDGVETSEATRNNARKIVVYVGARQERFLLRRQCWLIFNPLYKLCVLTGVRGITCGM
jgi:hypothetical protein